MRIPCAIPPPTPKPLLRFNWGGIIIKIKAIFYLLFAKRYYLYFDGHRQFKNMNIKDVCLINTDTSEVINEIQAQENVNAVIELIKN